MDWAAASGAPSWGAAAAADTGPTMLSFAGPSSSASASAAAAEARLQDFAAGLAQRARPAGAAGAGRRSRIVKYLRDLVGVDINTLAVPGLSVTLKSSF